MGRIIKLHRDDHREIQALLPWYVTGTLDARDHDRVEAHLVRCLECKAEVGFQRRLGAQIAGLPTDVEQGWQLMKRQIEMDSRSGRGRAIGDWLGGIGRLAWTRPYRSPRLGWGVAAVLAVLLGVAALVPPSERPAAYHVLGAAQTAAAGNVLLMFRPDTAERDLRAAMTTGKARIVDGPTQAGAYILHVAPADRDAALAAWRAEPQVVLAQPIDSGARP
jgi:anti-sigma-K factor RskA